MVEAQRRPGARAPAAVEPRGAAVRLVVHGGAGGPVRDEAPYHDALRAAAKAGWEALRSGSALDAVQAAAVALEDEPLFNAGRGSVLNEHGQVEHDAAIMCGRTAAVGAVAAVRGVRNPIALARVVMDRTPHVLLTGTGAEALAEREGVERVDPAWHVTERRESQWQAAGDT
ncbi:MAG: isoaspartyl peptidase/L-asparaginase, partial [Actinomycetota bacterium]|nr:isoaspartyl peptidase/L-asparaginase [Actinomycetota bacterium]